MNHPRPLRTAIVDKALLVASLMDMYLLKRKEDLRRRITRCWQSVDSHVKHAAYRVARWGYGAVMTGID